MDLWVVAAAAGAGYIAKKLQNLSMDEKENPVGPPCKYSHDTPSASRNILQQLREKTCPLRRLSRKTALDDSDVDFPEPALASTATGNALEESLDTEGAKNRIPFQRADMKKLARNRRRCMDSLRPLKSCLDEKTEDYKMCYYSSDSSAIRPLNSSFSEFEGCKDEETRNSGLERFESDEELRKKEGKYSHLFATAMAVGILSATSVWKTEVDNLNEQLKYMQNLVQDLQEELDMKEMISVKDLTREDGEKDTFDGLNGNKKCTENLELLSKIEAELQAELEMLENMEGSGVVELYPDLKPSIVPGELKSNIRLRRRNNKN